MSVTAATVEAAVARWIEEAKRLPAREAYRWLTRKARFVDREFRRCSGPAWSLSIARDQLLVAAASHKQ